MATIRSTFKNFFFDSKVNVLKSCLCNETFWGGAHFSTTIYNCRLNDKNYNRPQIAKIDNRKSGADSYKGIPDMKFLKKLEVRQTRYSNESLLRIVIIKLQSLINTPSDSKQASHNLIDQLNNNQKRVKNDFNTLCLSSKIFKPFRRTLLAIRTFKRLSKPFQDQCNKTDSANKNMSKKKSLLSMINKNKNSKDLVIYKKLLMLLDKYVLFKNKKLSNFDFMGTLKSILINKVMSLHNSLKRKALTVTIHLQKRNYHKMMINYYFSNMSKYKNHGSSNCNIVSADDAAKACSESELPICTTVNKEIEEMDVKNEKLQDKRNQVAKEIIRTFKKVNFRPADDEIHNENDLIVNSKYTMSKRKKSNVIPNTEGANNNYVNYTKNFITNKTYIFKKEKRKKMLMSPLNNRTPDDQLELQSNSLTNHHADKADVDITVKKLQQLIHPHINRKMNRLKYETIPQGLELLRTKVIEQKYRDESNTEEAENGKKYSELSSIAGSRIQYAIDELTITCQELFPTETPEKSFKLNEHTINNNNIDTPPKNEIIKLIAIPKLEKETESFKTLQKPISNGFLKDDNTLIAQGNVEDDLEIWKKDPENIKERQLMERTNVLKCHFQNAPLMLQQPLETIQPFRIENQGEQNLKSRKQSHSKFDFSELIDRSLKMKAISIEQYNLACCGPNDNSAINSFLRNRIDQTRKYKKKTNNNDEQIVNNIDKEVKGKEQRIRSRFDASSKADIKCTPITVTITNVHIESHSPKHDKKSLKPRNNEILLTPKISKENSNINYKNFNNSKSLEKNNTQSLQLANMLMTQLSKSIEQRAKESIRLNNLATKHISPGVLEKKEKIEKAIQIINLAQPKNQDEGVQYIYKEHARPEVETIEFTKSYEMLNDPNYTSKEFHQVNKINPLEAYYKRDKATSEIERENRIKFKETELLSKLVSKSTKSEENSIVHESSHINFDNFTSKDIKEKESIRLKLENEIHNEKYNMENELKRKLHHTSKKKQDPIKFTEGETKDEEIKPIHIDKRERTVSNNKSHLDIFEMFYNRVVQENSRQYQSRIKGFQGFIYTKGKGKR